MKFDPINQHYEWLKNLQKVKRRGYPLEQVIMVDDTPAKLAQHYSNLVQVEPFMGNLNDRELPLLQDYLPSLTNVENIRKIEKRNWRHKLASKR